MNESNWEELINKYNEDKKIKTVNSSQKNETNVNNE